MSEMTWRAQCKMAVRIGDLEFNTCDENLMQKKLQTHAEITKWNEDESRHVIATFEPMGESCDLRFVGDRPLCSDIDWDHFKAVVIAGFELMRLHREWNK